MAESVATFHAVTGRHRARVFRLSNGVYRVEVERLLDGFDAGGVRRGEFWSTIPGISSYTDNLERASVLAEECLRCGQAVES